MLAKVTELYVDTVYNDFETFFAEELKADNTRRAYKKDIEYFFWYMKNKNINELVYIGSKDKSCDLWFEYKDVLRYRNHLRDVMGKKSTINRKIAAMRKLYKYLAKNNYEVNQFAFEVDDLERDDLESSGVLTPDEAKVMWTLAEEMPNGVEKSIFLEVAWNTSIRVSALLSLTWKQIKNVKEKQWEIEVKDKGKINKQGISDELYNRLLTLKREDEERVFTLSYTTVYETVIEISRKMGIPAERNISPHSVRKSLIDWGVKVLKDPVAAAKQGNHNLEVMYKYYLSQNPDYSDRPAFKYKEGNDLTALKELAMTNPEKLFDLIQKASYSTQNELLSLLKQEK